MMMRRLFSTSARLFSGSPSSSVSILHEISGKNYIVAGGASGLGEACVRRLTSAGARVIIADLNEEAGRNLAQSISSSTSSAGSAIFARCDVTSEESVQAALDAGAEHFNSPELHGAITCAGVGVAQKVLNRDLSATSLEDFSRVVQVNLIGSFNVNRLAASRIAKSEPYSADGERGVLVNTASVAAFDGQVGQAAYSASKGGIVGLTLPLAREMARHGIRVLTIAPGLFDTPLLAGLPEKVRSELGMSVPFPKRLGNPAEFAALAHHMLANPMMNGEVVRLDGSIRMQA